MAKTWLITGASAGFGRALALAAVARGDRVVATARNLDDVAEFEHARELDVTNAAQVEKVIAEAVAELGGIDVVVNNAGHGMVGAVEELSDDDLRDLLDVNLLGVLRVTRAALPHLRRQGSGHIIQLSSVGGVVGNPGHAAYATSKFALEGMSEALAGEVAPWNIRVTIVEPGPFRTEFAGRSLGSVPAIPAYAETPAGRLRAGFRDQDGNQPNDPGKAAAAILAVVDAAEPPLRLPLGPQAVTRIRGKLHRQLVEIDEWQDLALDTAYDA